MPEINLRYVADARSATAANEKVRRGLRDTSSDAKKSADGFRHVTRAITGMVAAAGGIYLIKKALGGSISAASDLSEQINKTKVVFGEGSASVLAFSKTTATALGISSRAALEAAGTFGNMLVPMGFAREQAAQMSTRMVQLASDMASFNNADPSEVLEALRSGLAGETEPLRRFGVFLSDARLKQEALNLGLYDGKGALSASAKAAATYAVILKDTKDAQGDFARTSGGLANQQRILRAQVENLAAAFGEKLLPLATRAMKAITETLSDPKVKQGIESVGTAIANGIGAAVERLINFVSQHKTELRDLFQSALAVAETASRLTLAVADALLKLSSKIGDQKTALTALGLAWVAWQTGAVAAVAKVVAANIAGAATTGAAWRAALVATGWGAIAVAAGVAAAYIITHWTQVQGFFKHFGENVRAIWTATQAALLAGIKSIPRVLLGVFQLAAANILKVLAVMAAGASKALGWIPGIGGKVKSAAKAIDDFVKDLAISGARNIGKAGANMGKAFVDNLNLNLDVGLAKAAANIAAVVAASGHPDEGTRGPKTTGPGADNKVNVPTDWANPGAGHAGGQTAGLPLGRTAGPRDLFVGQAFAGTQLGAPESGTVAAYNPTGAQGGGSMYFVGDSGTTYWLGHIAIAKGVKVGDQVKAGDVIAIIADVSGEGVVPHLHIDKTTNKVNIPGSPSGGGPNNEAVLPPTTPATPTAEKTKKALKPVTVQAKNAAREAVAEAVGGLADVPDALKKHIADELAKASKLLRGVVKPTDLAEAKRLLAKAKGEIKNAIEFGDLGKDLARAQAQIAVFVRSGFFTDKDIAALKAKAKAVTDARTAALDDGVISDRELAKIKERQKALETAVKNHAATMRKLMAEAGKAAADLAKDQADMVASAFQAAGLEIAKAASGPEYAAAVTRYNAILARLRAAASGAAGKGLTQPVIDKLKAEAASLKTTMQSYIDTLVEGVNGARNGFNTAWDKFTALALQAFDRAHDEMRKALQVAVTFDDVTFDFGEGAQTPTEKLLADRAKKRAAEEKAARRKAAEEAVEEAKRTGQGLAEAQKELNDILYDEETDALEERARLEREAAEKALADAQRDFDDRTAVRREAFQTELADIQGQMLDGKLSYDEGLGKIRALFAKYETPFDEQSGALGTALQTALLSAFGAIETAMTKLQGAIERLVKALGGQVTEAESLSARAQRAYAAATAAQIQNANENRPGTGTQPFARGGIAGLLVPRAANGLIAGTYTPQDSLIARLSYGEMVLNPRQQARLFALAQGGYFGGQARPSVIELNVHGSILTEDQLLRIFRRKLGRYVASSGALGW